MKSLTIAILLTAIFYSIPTVVLADCPDEGRCWIAWGGTATQYQELGTFKTPTCYKFSVKAAGRGTAKGIRTRNRTTG